MLLGFPGVRAVPRVRTGTRVEELGQVGVCSGGHDKDGEAGGHPRASRGGVGAGDRPRVQAAGEEQVHQEQPVRGRHPLGEAVKRGEVEDEERTDVEHRGGHRIPEHVHGRTAQDPGERELCPPGQRTERQRHRRRNNQTERCVHPHQEVLGHVRPMVVVGQLHEGRAEPHGDQARPGDRKSVV